MKAKTNHPQAGGNMPQPTKDPLFRNNGGGDPDGNRNPHFDPSLHVIVCPFAIWARVTRELASHAKYFTTEGRVHLTESGRLLEELIDAERTGRIMSQAVDAYAAAKAVAS